MKTSKIWVMSLLATACLCGCGSEEEASGGGTPKAIQVRAGIRTPTRAVIDADYGDDLNVSFARMDHPDADTDWNTPSVDGVRAGGSGNTSVTFVDEFTYLKSNGKSVLIGYHPQAALVTEANPATVAYTITGNEDIMATEVQTGAANGVFTPFTFQHLLTQLQFQCVGSAEAIAKWTDVSSIKVNDVATLLTLSLDKTAGASLTTGSADQQLAVVNCPKEVLLSAATPSVGYLMLYPAADMGTAASAIQLEVTATYDGTPKTLTVAVDNIDGGVQAGESHLITLTFTKNGEISAEAGITEWKPGNDGSSEIIPGI